MIFFTTDGIVRHVASVCTILAWTTVFLAGTGRGMVLRLNENGMHALADFTRDWMNASIEDIAIDAYTHKIQRGLAAGDLKLQNISVTRFFPPFVRYRTSEHGLYMTTLGGQAELHAEWQLDSPFLSLFTSVLRGEVQGRIAGLQSEVAVKVDSQATELVLHRCSARFHDFRIRLSGSVAADVLHWFRAILGQAMKRRVEETYCRMVHDRLLPWLQQQITRLSHCLEVKLGDNIILSQTLHSLALTATHLDLRMKNRFGTNGHVIETLSTLPSSYPSYEDPGQQRMMELFVDEPTLQEIVSAAHFSDQLVANISSPFLRTECDMLCLGTLFPELSAEFGPTELTVQVKSKSAPIVRLLEDRAFVFLNASVELFDLNSVSRNTSNDIIDNNVDVVPPPMLDPVMSVEVSGEAELFLSILERRLRGKLKLRNTKVVMLTSKLVGMSQKTIDFIVNLSSPFLEDAIQLFLGDGVPLEHFFKVHSLNETLDIQHGFIRLQTNLAMHALVQ